ncbi:MAG: hypothetical protein P4L40_12880 [Terracidiphilus sp.]|nr:hypothetical protein [Terracidiphilus sp.]
MAKPKKMLRFSDHFGLAKSQAQLDFVDIPLETDIELYVDPYALHVSPVDWLRKCGDLVANYFDVLLKSLKARDRGKALQLLSNLHEPNETHLGLSRGKPSGRGWGQKQSIDLYNRLSHSKAVASGKLSDLSDFELLIPGIASDKISDLAINVIRGELAAYTQEQCALYDIPTRNVAAGTFWNPDDERWEGQYADLPVFNNSPLILVPKAAVRRRLVPDTNEFYNHFVLSFLQQEHLNANDSLVHTLRNGDPKVLKKDLKATYPLSKDFLFEFSEKHPTVLASYKKTLPSKAENVIDDEGIEGRQHVIRAVDAGATCAELRAIAVGQATASEYHKFMIGALTKIFYPNLTRPKKEQEVDQGRKRIDIMFHNSATKGFFSTLVNRHHYHTPYISVECKNYKDDPKNPELDQLLGRLNRKRGFVGILTCRTVEDKPLMLKRCQDVVNNEDKKLIIVLDDNDICKLLDFATSNEQKKIDEFMEDKLTEILM